ncbi:uncharacterized protein LOC128723564 [Anopheles nili]|uniref:uncharacterized protein LOC128723564 n=1 Tax=Anopheles nili TaxID=185578 RepID=UPI00237B5707|nr:uncharacterized protein LOC128723564 [Anopheles nili]
MWAAYGPHGAASTTLSKLGILLHFLVLNYYSQYYGFCTIGQDFFDDVPFGRILLSADDRLEAQLHRAVSLGCQAFIVDEPGVEAFLDLFIPVHDEELQRSLDKSVILLVTERNHEDLFARLVLHDVFRELPSVLVIVYDDATETAVGLYTTTLTYTGVLDRSYNVTLEPLSIDWEDWESYTFFPDKTSDLNGYVLRTSVVNYMPFTGYERVVRKLDPAVDAGNAYDGETGSRSIWLDGTELQLLVSFCERRNCNILTIPEDIDTWGDVYPNGTGNGLMGSVAMRHTDIAFGAFYLWLKPYNFSTYTATISRSGVTVLVPKPKMLPFWRTPFLSFSMLLWMAVIVTFFAGIAAAWIAGRVRYQLLFQNGNFGGADHVDLTAEQLTLSDAALMMVGFFVAQSSPVRNDLWSCVFLFASLLLAGFMVSNLYSGGLASVMTIPQFEKSIDSVVDFAASGMMWYGPTPYCLSEIWNATEPYLQQIQKTFVVAQSEETKEYTRSGVSGFIIEQAQHGNFAPSDFLDRESSTMLQPLKDDVYFQNCAALITKTNPLRANLNEYILRMQQAGILYHLGTMAAIRYLPTDVLRNIENARLHQQHGDGGAVKLEIGHFLGAFLILGYGLLIAALVFVVERWGFTISPAFTTLPNLGILLRFLVLKYYSQYYGFCTIGQDFLDDVPLGRILLSADDRLEAQLHRAVSLGCQAFIVDEPGVEAFLDLFIPVHDEELQRSLDKSVILLVTERNHEDLFARLVLHDVFRELPSVLVIVYNDATETAVGLYTTALTYSGVLDRSYNVTLEPLSIDWEDWESYTFFPDKTSDLNGYVLRTSVVNYMPFTGYERVVRKLDPAVDAGNAYDGETGSRSIWLDGTELQLLVSFCERRNCNILTIPEDIDTWGDVYPNGTGNGLMGSVAMRHTDIAFGAFYLWLKPYNFSTYTATISRSGVTVLVPKPKMLPFWRTPFLSFSMLLWMAVIVTFFAGIAAAWIAGRVRYQLLFQNGNFGGADHADLTAEQLTLSDAALMMVGFFVAQSSPVRNDLWSCVFLFASLLLAGFMVSNLYSGGLASVMTIPQYEKSIDTVVDFAATGMTWYGPTPYCLSEIFDATEPYLQKIITTYIAAPPEEARQHSHTGDCGFIIEQAQHGNFAPSDFLDRESSTMLQPLKDDIYFQNCAALITKTNPLRANLNEYILRMQQAGILYHLGTMAAIRYLPTDVLRNIENARLHQQHGDGGAVKLEIGHFLGAFLILGYGLLIAALVFVVERWGFTISSKCRTIFYS